MITKLTPPLENIYDGAGDSSVEDDMDHAERPVLRPNGPLKGVVFDLDDTLVVSTVDFPKFKRLVIERIGGLGDDPTLYDPSETIVAITERFEGRARDRGVADIRVREMMAQLDRIMDEVELERVDDTALIPGAADALKYLKERGLKVGVLTRGCHAYAQRAMARVGISAFVDATECRSSETRPKPYPDSYLRLTRALGVDKGDTVFVGDHAIDARCAMNAGVPFIGVGTGDVPEHELMEAGAFMFVRDVGELKERLRPFL